MVKRRQKTRGLQRSSKDALEEFYRHEPGFEHMVEDVFIWKAVPGKRSVRAVKREDDVYLYSTDETALREIHHALTHGANLYGKKIKAPRPQEVWDWVEESQRQRKRLR